MLCGEQIVAGLRNCHHSSQLAQQTRGCEQQLVGYRHTAVQAGSTGSTSDNTGYQRERGWDTWHCSMDVASDMLSCQHHWCL
jgi:hypothetical protein